MSGYCKEHRINYMNFCSNCESLKHTSSLSQADGIVEVARGWRYDGIDVTHIIEIPDSMTKDDKDNTLLEPQASPTGSLRFNKDKPITNEMDPAFLLGIGEVMEKSRAKYPRGNWAKGNDFSVPYDSMMRHLLAFQSGVELDPETNCDHLLHAATNLMFLYHYSKNFPEFDDRLFKKKK